MSVIGWLAALVLAGLLFRWSWGSKNRRWLKQGERFCCAHLRINDRHYYREQVTLDSYRKGFGIYGEIVNEVLRHGDIVEFKYDLYDWTWAYVQFADITVGIKHFRPLNRVQLVQSEGPVTIAMLEADNPFS